MSDNINKELVKNTFDKEYNREQFKIFIKELLNGIEERDSFHTNIPSQFKDYIKSYRRLGKYIFIDADNFEKIIDVIEVNLKRTSSVEKARSMQRNFVARYLNGTFGGVQREACLVAFINEDNPLDWRFSLVKMDYKTEIKTDKDGNKKRVIVEELTPAKRFSFLVGKNENTHTAQQQLFTCLEKSKKGEKLTLEDLTNAFNIEKVSQEFFDEYKKLFEIFCKELQRIYKSDSKVKEDFDNHNIIVEDFAKKTLGQLVFLYFIQKKGWLGVKKDEDWGKGNKKFLRALFDKEYVSYNNFFNDILEPLFYEALATDRGTASYFDPLKCRIPFLNGGLFEPINNYSWTTTDLTIKNTLFKEIFDVFDLYNFTVKEDEPLEKEIAIDPEMLGKVFENLLPENIRKGNGAFYTPREIVHYMCQESLINYLDTQLNRDNKIIEKEDISILVKRADSVYINKNQGNSEILPKSIKPNAKVIDTALANIKICDPAIGSGAFPVGIMTELVRIRMALNDYLEQDKNRTSYELKRNAIENSIYGVDLDSGAVEIAKLRFYLSLVVDEENIKDIRPLPNLDFKIMQGNSLISSYEGIDFDKILENNHSGDFLFSDDSETIIEEIKQNLDEYINIPYATKKSEIREEIENLMIKLIKNKLENSEEFKGTLSNFQNKKTQGSEKNLKLIEEKISNLIANRENRNFFPWKLFFADVFKKGGFDIVIGNPPYIFSRDSKEKGISNQDKEYYYKHFCLAKYQINLYHLFVERGTNLLTNNGIFSYIIPNNWLTINTNKELRKFVLTKSDISIINFYTKVFETADVDSSILIFTNSSINRTIKLSEAIDKNTIKLIKETNTDFFTKNKDFIINTELLKNTKYLTIVDKIELKSNELIKFANVKAGLQAYEIGKGTPTITKKMKDNRIYHSMKKETNKHYKYLNGVDVCRYSINWSGEYLKYGNNLAAPRTFDLYSTPRILVRQIPSKPPHCINACFLNEIILNDRNSMNIIDISLNPYFLLGILNSKLISFWFQYKFGKLQRGLFPQFKINELKTFPIVKLNLNDNNIQKQKYNKIIELVKNILNIQKQINTIENEQERYNLQKQSTIIDEEIDKIVYELYDLTQEERKIIECI